MNIQHHVVGCLTRFFCQTPNYQFLPDLLNTIRISQCFQSCQRLGELAKTGTSKRQSFWLADIDARPNFASNAQTFNFSTVPSASPVAISITGILLTEAPASVISRAADAIASALSHSIIEAVTMVPGGSSTPGKGSD